MGQPVNIIRDARSYGKAAHHQKQWQSGDLSVGQKFTHIASHHIASRRCADKQRGSAKSDQTEIARIHAEHGRAGFLAALKRSWLADPDPSSSEPPA